MPYAPGRPCSHPGCTALVRGGGRCEEHRVRRPDVQRWRGSPASRGYDKRWEQLRANIIAGEPLCRHCAQDGRVTPAVDVDHIVPLDRGGARLDPANLQPLCRSCHNRKTRQEAAPRSGPAIPTVVVCGPPGSGKSTYARQRMQPGDLLVDVDALMAALSGVSGREASPALVPFACEARDAVVERIARGGHVGAAWVVTQGAEAGERDRLRDLLGARVVVLEVSQVECERRIAADETRPDKARWRGLIAEWWSSYQRSGRDEVVRG